MGKFIKVQLGPEVFTFVNVDHIVQFTETRETASSIAGARMYLGNGQILDAEGDFEQIKALITGDGSQAEFFYSGSND